MIAAAELVECMVGRGVTTVTGVPCSYLTPLINRAISDPAVRYLASTQEGEAAALAAGSWLGGGLGCAFTQNSGLGNMVNPVTSLLRTASIPVLLVVTWRGQPGHPDEPQHELMGRITTDLLRLMEIDWALLPDESTALPEVVDRAARSLAEGGPYALVVRHGTVAREPLDEQAPVGRASEVIRHGGLGELPTRAAALTRLLSELPEEVAVVSTTGWTSRELYTLADRQQHFYLVGAMGSAAAVGLGVALQTPRPVVVIDGDGALLMRLGSLATVGAHSRSNLVHVVLDNGVHDSTGGQRTLSTSVDLVAAAAACGYEVVHEVGTLTQFAAAVRAGLSASADLTRGPTLVHLRISPGSLPGLGRPSVTPVEVARRFRTFVTTDSAGAGTAATGSAATASAEPGR